MMSSYTCESTLYQFSSNLDSFLKIDDRVFISSHGTFISRGTIAKVGQLELAGILSDLKSPDTQRQPFVVFAEDFDSVNNRLIDLPSEMIFIDNNDWVTHFLISADNSSPQISAIDTSRAENPHYIEMMSPESKDQFIDKVQTVLKHIEAGQVEKVVIARQLNVTADIDIDTRLLIAELIKAQPSSYVFCIDGFIGASPELLVEKFSRSIKSLPMAGTRRRHARIDEDDAEIADLINSTKDLNEHRVVVENIVANLEAVTDNVHSATAPHVERFPHVAHLATSITATAKDNTNLFDIIDAIHPTPAVAGTPTSAALQIIRDIEDFDRKIYGAPVGWIDSNGDGQCAVALRCAYVDGNMAHLFAGVGIVHGSDPELEYDETQVKFGTIRDALMNITQ